MIRFDRVSVGYGNTQALSDVSLELDPGSITFVTGHSGAGKSTLLKVLMSLILPSRGRVSVNGVDLAALTARQRAAYRRGIGVVLQDHHLLTSRDVIGNVRVPLELLGLRGGEADRRARAALDAVNLLHLARRFPSELSTGERQRVGIARAVVHRPRLLVADEPTGNLDPDLSQEIMGLFGRFHQMAGTTVVIATHELELVRACGHPAIALADGRVRQAP